MSDFEDGFGQIFKPFSLFSSLHVYTIVTIFIGSLPEEPVMWATQRQEETM